MTFCLPKGELRFNGEGPKLKRTRIKRPSTPPNPSDEIFNVASLARYLHCHRATVYRLLREKKIPAFKLGSDWRFMRSAIDDWIARLRGADLPVIRGNVRGRRL